MSRRFVDGRKGKVMFLCDEEKEDQSKITIKVPFEKRSGKAVTAAYEVLVFYGKFEFDQCNEEKDFRKKIEAKFKNYEFAFNFSRFLSQDPTICKIILRI